jgi:hypothetical protein
MVGSNSILKALSAIKPKLFERYPISSLAVFGSCVREDFSENSDVDILVEFNGEIGSRFIELADEIEKYLGVQVDLVSKKGIRPKYFKSIEKDLIHV